MQTAEIKQIIRRELPLIIQKDVEIQQLVLRLARTRFADKAKTEDRFDRILDELRQDREAQSKKWDEQNIKWDEQNKKWDEQNEKWDGQNKKWERNQNAIDEMLQEIRNLSRKHDSTIGALGAR